MALTALEIQVAAPRRRSSKRLRNVLLATLTLILLTLPLIIAVGMTWPIHLTMKAEVADWIGPKWRNVAFASHEDQVPLKGWLFNSEHPNGRSVVFIHGWYSQRYGNHAPLARQLIKDGYDVLLFDQRASGESGGDHQTLGNKEWHDVLAAYDFMQAQGYQPAKMGMIGVSMGGASLLEASDQMPTLGAVVVDSGYAELRPLLEAELGRRLGPLSFYTGPTLALGPLFGVDPDLRPVDKVRAQAERPILFFHSDSDELIPFAQAQELRAASHSPQSDLVVIHNAAHSLTYEQEPDTYRSRLYQFFDQQLKLATPVRPAKTREPGNLRPTLSTNQCHCSSGHPSVRRGCDLLASPRGGLPGW